MPRAGGVTRRDTKGQDTRGGSVRSWAWSAIEAEDFDMPPALRIPSPHINQAPVLPVPDRPAPVGHAGAAPQDKSARHACAKRLRLV